MFPDKTTGREPRSRRRGIIALATVLCVLFVQFGLVVHEASHRHPVGETGDCHLCVLATHLFLDQSSFPDPDHAGPVAVMSPEPSLQLPDRILPFPAVRGPPAASV